MRIAKAPKCCSARLSESKSDPELNFRLLLFENYNIEILTRLQVSVTDL